MDQITLENENSSDYEPISTLEAFNSLFDNTNQDSLLNPINQSIDNQKIILEVDSNKEEELTKKSCKCNLKILYYKVSDIVVFLILILNIFFDLVTAFIIIFEIAVSIYSIIIMNYVFFVSSIVSYMMAPVYKILSSDWLNFVLSFLQVILASPLIAFYIFFILVSVVGLGEIVSNFFDIVKDIFSVFKGIYKKYFEKFLTKVFKNDYELIFDNDKFLYSIEAFMASSMMACMYLSIGYVLFFLDKCIIIVGIVEYLFNILRIIILLVPSYIYFVNTLLNIKCKRIMIVERMIKLFKIATKNRSSEKSDSTDSIFKKIDASDSSSNKHKKSEESSSDSSQSSLLTETSTNKSSFSSETNRNKYVDPIIKFLKENQTESIDTIIDKIESNQMNFDMDESSQSEVILYQDYFENSVIRSTKFLKVAKIFYEILFAEEFNALYYYSTSIAFDRYKQNRKRFCMLIFFILNLFVISYDIYQLTQDYSDYLLSSIIIRFILIPLFSYFNLFTVLYHKAKNKALRIVNYISVVLTFFIIIVIIIGFVFISIYRSKYRLSSLEYFPPLNNITIANEKTLIHPICAYNIFNISAFDAFGYALGGYDVKRNETIFENQMGIFFGENYSDHINYTVYELDENFLFLKYYDSETNSHIFAFRGYNSGPEIAFQFELFASKYIIPFFEDNVPFLESINENWLSFYTDFLNAFGLRFFENRNLIVKYVKSIRKIYEEFEFNDNDNVLFTGINCGGVLAKIIGTLLYRRSISFISFPMEMDFLQNWFHFESFYESYVTNVFNVDGFFSFPDSDYAINIGIDIPIFFKSKYCTSDFCDIFSKTDNVYRTFCTMSEICGKGNQFHYYCLKSIGEKDIRMIRESLQDDDD